MRAPRNRVLTAGALTVTAALALTACAGDDNDGGSSGSAATIEYWSGIVGTDGLVDEWNAANPDTTVAWSNATGSVDEQASKLIAAVGAGNAPCLAMVQNDRIPSLLAAGVFEDVTDLAAPRQDLYYEGTWDAVTLDGATYGLPSSTGPMAMFYRADLFEQYGLEVPTTWQQLADESAALTAANPGVYLTGLAPDDAQGFVSDVQQVSDPWFSIDGDSWKVDVDNDASRQVADYWQGLLDADLVNTTMRWDPTFYNDLSDGRQLALIGGAWQAPLIAANVAGGAGSWAVAPMPTWEEGDAVSASNGGSSIMVVKGCADPEAALDFAEWFTTDVDGNVDLGEFPAADVETVPTPAELSEYFGGQDVNTTLADAARTIRTGWLWSPMWNSAQTVINDAMGAAVDGTGTLGDLLATIQENQVSSMTDSGISVAD